MLIECCCAEFCTSTVKLRANGAHARSTGARHKTLGRVSRRRTRRQASWQLAAVVNEMMQMRTIQLVYPENCALAYSAFGLLSVAYNSLNATVL
jgi:hypothetical protein